MLDGEGLQVNGLCADDSYTVSVDVTPLEQQVECVVEATIRRRGGMILWSCSTPAALDGSGRNIRYEIRNVLGQGPYLLVVRAMDCDGDLLGEPCVFAFDSLGEEKTSLVLLGSKVQVCALD